VLFIIANCEEKEAKALVKIAEVLNKLDSNLEELDSLNEDGKKHSMKKWLVEKRVMYKIKKIAHEAGKYDKYDEKEIDHVEQYMQKNKKESVQKVKFSVHSPFFVFN